MSTSKRSNRTTRREFLQRGAATGAALGMGYWISPRCFGQSEATKLPTSPNEKLNIAVIGVARRGAANLEEIQTQNIVALCDVDAKALEGAAQRFPKAAKHDDFREMLESPKEKFDAVLIATADHCHVPASVMAMNLGKHVYCEKPLAHNVYEARLCAETAKKTKRVTQMGIQIHAESNYRRVVELIKAGAIGPVSEVHVFIDKKWSPDGDPPRMEQPVPEGLNWDAWLGPAPEQPYRTNTLPANWRKWWDFGNGTLGDMGCHYMDLPFWALGLRHPTRVEAEGPPVDPEGTPPWIKVHYEFPARGGQPPVKMTWYDGGKKPEQYAEWNLKPEWKNGVVFVGTEGRYLYSDYYVRRLFPADDFAQFEPPPKSIPESKGHHNEWVRACLANDPSKTLCNFDYSGALTEAVLLGNVSYRVGKPLEWDAKSLRATNAPEAIKYLRREYRKGWELNVG
jgi:predicted dehydrogenase